MHLLAEHHIFSLGRVLSTAVKCILCLFCDKSISASSLSLNGGEFPSFQINSVALPKPLPVFRAVYKHPVLASSLHVSYLLAICLYILEPYPSFYHGTALGNWEIIFYSKIIASKTHLTSPFCPPRFDFKNKFLYLSGST